MLAAAAAVHALGVLRDPGIRARLLGLAALAILDRGVPAAPAQSPADRPARRRPAVGTEEPQSPVRARRAARRLPGRARHPDAPRAADGDRVRVQPGGARLGRLVAGL